MSKFCYKIVHSEYTTSATFGRDQLDKRKHRKGIDIYILQTSSLLFLDSCGSWWDSGHETSSDATPNHYFLIAGVVDASQLPLYKTADMKARELISFLFGYVSACTFRWEYEIYGLLYPW